MKKKGLIISTVVMVVVLLASLTTATYAWFSATADARIAPIGMTATAAEGILIGVRKDTTATTVTRTDFVNGDVNWTASDTANKTLTDGKWTGTGGFGSLLTPQVGGNALQLNVSQAMTKNETGSSINDAIFKKAPAGANDSTPGTFTAATANVDYIQLDLGLIASTNKTIDQIIGTIKVTPSDSEVIGMAAAVHFEIAVKAPGAEDWTSIVAGGNGDVDLSDIESYGGREAGVSTFTETTGYDGQLDTSTKVWTYDFPVWKATAVANALSTSGTLDVVQVKLLAWIEGTDDSCTTAYTGTGATIDVSFDYSAISTGDYTVSNGRATQASDPKAVTFVGGEGADTTVANVYGEIGDTVNLPVAPTAKSGYTFKGWSQDGGTTLKDPGFEYTIVNDTGNADANKWTAIWEKTTPVEP